MKETAKSDTSYRCVAFEAVAKVSDILDNECLTSLLPMMTPLIIKGDSQVNASEREMLLRVVGYMWPKSCDSVQGAVLSLSLCLSDYRCRGPLRGGRAAAVAGDGRVPMEAADRGAQESQVSLQEVRRSLVVVAVVIIDRRSERRWPPRDRCWTPRASSTARSCAA